MGRQQLVYLAIHQFFCCRVNAEDVGVPGLHPAVKNNGRFKANMKSLDG
jgi:hypothetical protein